MKKIQKYVVKIDKIEKDFDEILEILKKSPINILFVEEEIVVDMKFASETSGLKMLVDSGALLSIVSER